MKQTTMTRDEIVRLDKRHVWHPYTPMDEYEASGDPLVITRASGSRLYDVDGRSYFDANSSWWVAAVGHCHPRLVKALAAQAASLSHCAFGGITHEPAARLAEELVAVCPPGLTRVFFTDDGSTAIEAAVKMSVQLWSQSGAPKKTRFVALEGAFHGESVGATSLGGVEVFRRPFAGIVFDCLRAPVPDARGYEQAFEALATILAKGSDQLAAVVLEPLVQGANGMRMYPPAFLREARALCDRHDVLLVLDEVFTGYGRTGTFWAADQANVTPDLLCTAKGFSGGMLPMAAVVVTERVFDAFRGSADRAFYYGHSFAGNPLGAAVAREVLAIFRDEKILEGIPSRNARIERTFRRLAELPGVSDARTLGMIGAIDLKLDVAGSFDAEAGYLSRAGWLVHDQARRRGAYLRPLGDVVYVAPPLNITEGDLDELLGIVEESVTAVMKR